jgi:hypothetical protein
MGLAFTYDPTTDRGKVRLIIRDTDTLTVANQFFTDLEIDTYLGLNGNDGTVACLKLSAADALDTWASNEAMVTKVVTRLDVSTNGAAVAKALRDHADKLRTQAAESIAASDSGFDIAQMALPPFGVEEQYEAALET